MNEDEKKVETIAEVTPFKRKKQSSATPRVVITNKSGQSTTVQFANGKSIQLTPKQSINVEESWVGDQIKLSIQEDRLLVVPFVADKE
jgi:hypothetical protein